MIIQKPKIYKKFWVLICNFSFCILIFAFLSGCVDNSIKNINSRGTQIICFGDSITAGYGVKDEEKYPAILSKLLNMPVVNAGIESDTSAGALQRIKADILERDPFLVVVEFGGNDFLYKVPMEETLENMRRIVDMIQAKGAMVALVDINADIFLGEYSPLLQKIAREKGAIFIPKAFTGLITNPRLKVDFIHPNIYGYRIIAHRIYRGILPYVTRNRILRGFTK